MQEMPEAASERARLLSDPRLHEQTTTPLARHILHGLAYTVGSALGLDPPTAEQCRVAYLIPNKAGLTAGARAWSKHARRSLDAPSSDDTLAGVQSMGWWGTPSGPVAKINAGALSLLDRVTENASWRNLHWLPHQVLVYELRVEEGYGMRWSQYRGGHTPAPWVFRGFVEPAVVKH